MPETNTKPAQIGNLPSELSMKDAVGLLFSFAQTINPTLGAFMTQVAQLARQIGENFHFDNQQLDHIEAAAMIHDIGLLALAKELQNKEAHLLTEAQYRLYCEHPVIAAITLECIDALADIGEIILYHHEYWNGKGFPNGLEGDQIPLGSQILLATADYCRILTTWPRNMRRLVNHARRHLGADEWKRIRYTEDPESIIEASAERLLLIDIEGKYNPEVVKALIQVIHRENNTSPADMIPLAELKCGMVLMDDIHLEGGRLLLTKGTKLLDTSVQTLQSLGERGLISNEIYVAPPES